MSDLFCEEMVRQWFALRRTPSALRAALAATKPNSSVVIPKTRTFITLSQSKARPVQRWSAPMMQRRLASDVADAEKAAEEKAVESATEESTATETPAETATETATEATEAPRVVPESSAPPTEQSAADQPPNSTLYVGNLFFEVQEPAIESFFGKYGAIKSTRIVKDARGLSKGFGYVEFEDVDSAMRAIDGANQQVFEGRRLAVQLHRPRQRLNVRRSEPNPPSKTLFIGNMSFEMSDKDLSDLFREVRNVIDVRIAIDRRTGQPRGFAHADFIDVASATKAKEFLQDRELYGRRLKLDYSISTPRRAGDNTQ